MYPAVPPSPPTEPPAFRGNVSDTSVYKFELNPWCPATASPITHTAGHIPLIIGTNALGKMQIVHASSATFRAAFTLYPRLIITDDNHPPAMLPRSAIR